MQRLAPDPGDADTLEDVGHFFRYLGGVKFSRAWGAKEPADAPGHAQLLAVSSRYGLTFFSDLTGECPGCSTSF